MDNANDQHVHPITFGVADQTELLARAGSYGQLLLRELRSRGLEPDQQLRALAIREADGFLHFASGAQFADFVALAAQLASDPALGLRAGAGLELKDLGLLGLLLRAAPDGGSMRAYMERFRDQAPLLFDLELFVGDTLVMSRRSLAGLPRARLLSECFLAGALKLVCALFGPVQPIEVRLAQPAPAELAEHRRLLGENLRFDQAEDALVFGNGLLSRPLPHADVTEAEVLVAELARRAAAHESSADLTRRVRAAIRQELGRGRATTRRVASQLSLSERTMRRHLSERGASFQGLLDEVRRDLALRYLREASFTTAELSARLGFNGAAAFCRAFRRWTGRSLTEYRAIAAPPPVRARPRRAQATATQSVGANGAAAPELSP